MDNQNFKKSVFGGFDRDEVLDYVDKITIEHKNKIDDLEVQLKKDIAQKSQLKVEVEKLRQELEAERKENERIKQLNLDLGKKINAIIAENESIRDTSKVVNIENDESYKKLQEELNDKTERLLSYTRLGIDAEKVMKDAEERAKALLAKANNQAGQLILKANDEGKEIVQKAHRDAQKVKDEMKFIEATLLKLKAKANKEADDIVSQAKERANRIDVVTKEKLALINAEINKHNEQIAQIKRNILSITRAASNQIDQISETSFQPIKFESLTSKNPITIVQTNKE